MRTGAQRAVGWCETVERSHGTRLGASVRTPEYLESRRRELLVAEKQWKEIVELAFEQLPEIIQE